MANNRVDKTIPLSETLKFIVDNRGKTAPTAASGIALIATNCVTNEHLYPLRERLRFVSQATYDTWFRSHPQPGDILLTNKGSQNGAVCLVPDPVDFAIAQDMVAIRANEEVIDPLYLFAALRSPAVQQQIKNLDVSGVIPHFKKTDFDKLLIPHPDQGVQQRIGQIYFDLSSRIEISRRMNETLHAIAAAIFRSWFVGETTGDPTSLDQIADFLNGLALQKFPPTGKDDLSVIKIAELRRGNTKGSDLASSDIPPEYVVQDGDVLFSWSGSLEVVVWCGGNGALNQHLFKVTSTKYPKWFYYFWLKEHLEHFRAIAASKATTMGHIQRHHLTEAQVNMPPDKMLEKGDAVIGPLFRKIVNNNLKSRTSAELRDTLLATLMSSGLANNRPKTVAGVNA